MPLAALCGLGDQRLVDVGWPGAKVLPEDVVIIGVRSVDEGEREHLRRLGVTVYTMKEVDRLGLPRIAEETVARLSPLPAVHVSLDADVLDPEIAPGVGTPIPGGLTYREAHLLMELLSDAGIATSLDLVEVNPILDRSNRTAEMMVGLAASLLGKSIL
jgi:arginase